MTLWVGTSGWQYRHWRETFYQAGVPVRTWLEHYAVRFATVEVNNAFYRLPEAETFAAWARRTPEDFLFAVKASRYLTHVRRLREPGEAVARLMERAARLGPKLGPVLLQLPPTMRADPGALRETLAAFGPDLRVAVEPRHESWWTRDVRDVLQSAGAALCLADRRGPLTPEWRTAPWGYVRFHEGRAAPSPCYGRAALRAWAVRVAELWGPDADVYAYFNNDPRACAIRDARAFAAAAAREGLRPTRVPAAGEVRVA